MGLLASFGSGKVEAGLDEVGRGCIAGPVVAAAVILPENYQNEALNDSKKLSAKQRENLKTIIERDAVDFAVAEVSHMEIDAINILNASFKAMHLALDKLKSCPEFLLVDGNRFQKYKELEYTCVIKGDGKYASIAAASILAKTYRDSLMQNLAKTYPEYGWQTNVGYPTKAHREAVRKFGATTYHRKTFKLLPEQLTLGFDKKLKTKSEK